MNNIYKTIATRIQESIDRDNIRYCLSEIESYSDLPRMYYIDGVRMVLTENNGVYDAIKNLDFGVSGAHLTMWKTMPIGKFLQKDWKHQVVFGDKTPYSELFIAIQCDDDNYLPAAVLLRSLADRDLLDQSNFADLTIDGTAYGIIKAVALDVDNNNEDISLKYNQPSVLEQFQYQDEKIYDSYCLVQPNYAVTIEKDERGHIHTVYELIDDGRQYDMDEDEDDGAIVDDEIETDESTEEQDGEQTEAEPQLF